LARSTGFVVVFHSASNVNRPNNECDGKPFHYPELLARVTAVLRRRIGRRRGPIRVGELIIDPVTRRIRVGERRVELANKEFVG